MSGLDTGESFGCAVETAVFHYGLAVATLPNLYVAVVAYVVVLYAVAGSISRVPLVDDRLGAFVVCCVGSVWSEDPDCAGVRPTLYDYCDSDNLVAVVSVVCGALASRRMTWMFD